MKQIIYLIVLMLLVSSVLADTGTYTINKEAVEVSLNNDGSADLNYQITMTVNSGNIPWATIGMPNSNYQIISKSGSTKSLSRNDGYGWTGVRADLDRTYNAGEKFTYGGIIRQKNFISKSGDQAVVSFTPMWWDRAVIENLVVTYTLPASISATDKVTMSSQPTRYRSGQVIWEWTNVGQGQKKSTGMSMPISAFPVLRDAPVAIKPTSSPANDVLGAIPDEGTFMLVIGLSLAGVLLVAFIFAFTKKIPYTSPSLSLGSSTTSSKRHINMNCENCSNKINPILLKKDTIKDVTIDVCTVCGAMFLDSGEIEKLIKADVEEKDIWTKFAFTPKAPNMLYNPTACMRCEGDMEKVTKTVDSKTMTIYPCDDCSGLWLNSGMYQLIKDKRLLQEKENKSKKCTSRSLLPAYWLFYPHIYSTGPVSQSHVAKFSGGSSGGGGTSGSYAATSSYHSSCVSSCVSCACVSACACACACAGGGAAGCSPKDTIEGINIRKLGGFLKEDLNNSNNI